MNIIVAFSFAIGMLVSYILCSLFFFNETVINRRATRLNLGLSLKAYLTLCVDDKETPEQANRSTLCFCLGFLGSRGLTEDDINEAVRVYKETKA